MNAKWNYNDDGTAYADGTGTFEKGWYAALTSTIECGQSPDAGPFETLAEAFQWLLENEELKG